MTVVTARVKPREMWPDWARCCSALERDFVQQTKIPAIAATFPVDLADTLKSNTQCRYCGHECTIYGPKQTVTGRYIPFDMIDIDEGS